MLYLNFVAYAQKEKISNQRFVMRLSAPELLHLGYSYRINNKSQIGVNTGIGPTLGGVWSTVSLEHRLYVGENDKRINQKTFFLRQGATLFPSARQRQKFSLNLTVGKDVVFKKKQNGITIDAGVFYLPDSERSSVGLVKSLNLLPALRFQFYCSL